MLHLTQLPRLRRVTMLPSPFNLDKHSINSSSGHLIRNINTYTDPGWASYLGRSAFYILHAKFSIAAPQFLIFLQISV